MTMKAENLNIISYINLIILTKDQRVFIIFPWVFKLIKHQRVKINIHVKQDINISYQYTSQLGNLDKYRFRNFISKDNLCCASVLLI